MITVDGMKTSRHRTIAGAMKAAAAQWKQTGPVESLRIHTGKVEYRISREDGQSWATCSLQCWDSQVLPNLAWWKQQCSKVGLPIAEETNRWHTVEVSSHA